VIGSARTFNARVQFIKIKKNKKRKRNGPDRSIIGAFGPVKKFGVVRLVRHRYFDHYSASLKNQSPWLVNELPLNAFSTSSGIEITPYTIYSETLLPGNGSVS
jgi:hypothetical protein